MSAWGAPLVSAWGDERASAVSATDPHGRVRTWRLRYDAPRAAVLVAGYRRAPALVLRAVEAEAERLAGAAGGAPIVHVRAPRGF